MAERWDIGAVNRRNCMAYFLPQVLWKPSCAFSLGDASQAVASTFQHRTDPGSFSLGSSAAPTYYIQPSTPGENKYKWAEMP